MRNLKRWDFFSFKTGMKVGGWLVEHRFEAGFAVFLLLAAALGAQFGYLNKKVGERPGNVMAATVSYFHKNQSVTVNALTADSFNAPNSGVSADAVLGVQGFMPGNCDNLSADSVIFRYSSDIYIKHADGTENLLLAGAGPTDRDVTGGARYLIGSAVIPQTVVAPTDAIKIVEKITVVGTTGAFIAPPALLTSSPHIWVSPQIGANRIDNALWVFYRYTDVTTSATGFCYDHAHLKYGDATYSTRVEGISYTINDIAAPTIPGGLTTLPVSNSQINLNWTDSTDNVGVTGYKIYRNGVQIGTSAVNSFDNNSGLSPATSYNYTVSAYDAAGNNSAQSAIRVGTTFGGADAISPTVPTGLITAWIGVRMLGLSWTPSTDNVGVVGYRIFRDGVQVGVSASNSFTDTGLTPSTAYSYKVSAYDAAGNNSAQSSPLAVTTNADVTPPSTSSGAPVGSLMAGTVQTTISLTTGEDATCKYSTVAGVAYGSMSNVFSVTGTTTHSSLITGLTNGNSYNYYVRCQDAYGNSNISDYVINFSVSNWLDLPTRINGQPSGTLPIGTVNATLSLNTDSDSTCKYSTSPNVAYSSMTSSFAVTGLIGHSAPLNGLTPGSYDYYVRCFSVGNPATGFGRGDGYQLTPNNTVLPEDDKPVVVYKKQFAGGLMLVKCGDQFCSSGNTSTLVDTTDSGYWGDAASVVLGSDGLPVVFYGSNSSALGVKVAKCTDAACTSAVITIIDPAAIQIMDGAAAVGSDGLPVYSYRDWTNGNLKVVKCGNSTCNSGNTVATVESIGGVGHYSSVTLDSSNNPVIAYSKVDDGTLRVAHCGNPSCSSGNTIVSLEATNYFDYVSILLNSGGKPVVAYKDASNQLAVMTCGDVNCSAGNVKKVVETGVGLITGISMTKSLSGYPLIVFGGINRLKYLRCSDEACSSLLDSKLIVSADEIWRPGIILGSDNYPIISYLNHTKAMNNALQSVAYIKCGNETCDSPTTVNTSDFHISFDIPSASPITSQSNVHGYAWSSDTGWIKFSSSTLPVGKREKLENENRFAADLDSSINKAKEAIARLVVTAKVGLFGIRGAQNSDVVESLFGELAYSASTLANQLSGMLTAGIKIAMAAVTDYTVNIDNNGDFTGYAWSDNVGWIYFGPDATLPTYGDQRKADAPSAPKIWAHYDSALTEDNVTGWAKILALGNDGWIKMSDETVGTWQGKGVNISPAGDFSGWGWNAGAGGTAGIGWVSFNFNTCDTDENGTVDAAEAAANGCPTGSISVYKVTMDTTGPNLAPTAVNMSAPNWASSSAKVSGALHASLRWEFKDSNNTCVGGVNGGNVCMGNGDCPGSTCDIQDTQAAYQVVIEKSDGTSVFDSGMVTGMAGSAAQFDATPYIALNEAYKWWLAVWDDKGASSSLIQYNTNSMADTDADVGAGLKDSDPTTFQTFTHEYPSVYFTWTPNKPSGGENVQFLSSTTTAPGYSITGYEWTFTNTDISTSPLPNPTAKINSGKTTTQIDLVVTDSGGYQNSTSTNFDSKLKLPKWQEVAPK